MLSLRRAEQGDAADLLAWRNDPLTRRSSFDEHEVTPEEHRRWLVAKLADEDCALMIVEDDGNPIGQLRLDRVSPDAAEVSIALAPGARGRGSGRAILIMLVQRAPSLLSGIRVLRARVKPGNAASLRAFEAAGFHQLGGDASTRILTAPIGAQPPE